MKYRNCVVLCLVLLGAAVLSGCKKQTPTEEPVAPAVKVTDVDRLQGTWQGTEAGSTEPWTIVITGDQLNVDGPGPQDYSGTLTVDETTAPKTAVIAIETCGYEPYIGTTANSIYQLNDNALTMAATEPGSGTQPVGFEPDGVTRVFTLKKVQTP